MAPKEVINYLREGLMKGFKFGDLKNKLLQNGFSEGDIDEAFKIVQMKKGPSFGALFYVIFIVGVLILAVVVFFVFRSFADSEGGGLGDSESQESLSNPDSNFYRQAVKGRDVGLCDSIEDVEKRDKCKVDVSAILKDVGYCDSLSYDVEISFLYENNFVSVPLKDYCYIKMSQAGVGDCFDVSEDFKEVCENV